MQWKGTNIFVTNIPKPSNKIHSPLTLGLTLLSSDSNVRREGRPLNCYLQPSSSYKGVLDCLHDLTAISTLRVKTWQNQKPVCHMSTSPELALFFADYYKHWAPSEPCAASQRFLSPSATGANAITEFHFLVVLKSKPALFGSDWSTDACLGLKIAWSR
jgi:hypothetical protein